MNKLLVVLMIFVSSVTALAQTTKSDDEKAAGSVADNLFAAMKAKSFDGIKALFIPEGQLIAIDQPRDGKGPSKTRAFSAEAFAKQISEAKAPDFLEVMPKKSIMVDGDLAVVSGRYTFHVGDKFSHCGNNTFNLVRTATGWMIANAASTLEFQCENDLKPSVARKQFVIVLRLLPKYQNDAAWTPEASAAVGRHFARLQALQKEGRLFIAGRTPVKESMGLVIFEAENEAEARKVMAADDAVKAGIMSAEIFPFETALIK